MNTLELPFGGGTRNRCALGDGITLLRGFADIAPAHAAHRARRRARAVPPPGDARRADHVGGHDQLRPAGLGQRSQRLPLQLARSADWQGLAADAATSSRALALDAAAPLPDSRNSCPTPAWSTAIRPAARLTAHRDADEQNFAQPIVSVSLGLPASFAFYGLTRGGKGRTVALADGDVLVWGGPARLVYHAVRPIKPGHAPADRGVPLQPHVPARALSGSASCVRAAC